MARHIRKQFPGAKYHVTNRGNGRQEIFAESGDSDRFVEQLTEAAERDGVILYAYCLMPNHFHLSVMSMGPYAIGEEDFQQETTEWAIAQGRRRKRPVDAIVPERNPVSMSTIERAVVREFNLKAGVLKCKSARLGSPDGSWLNWPVQSEG